MERNAVFKEKPGVVARTAEIQVAMLQWYMLSKSTYCITNTVKASTFALTAIVTGECQFVVVPSSGQCSTGTLMPDKEVLIESSLKLRAMPGIKEQYTKKETIWNGVEKAPKMVSEEECFRKGKTGDIKPVLPYWQSSGVSSVAQSSAAANAEEA